MSTFYSWEAVPCDRTQLLWKGAKPDKVQPNLDVTTEMWVETKPPPSPLSHVAFLLGSKLVNRLVTSSLYSANSLQSNDGADSKCISSTIQEAGSRSSCPKHSFSNVLTEPELVKIKRFHEWEVTLFQKQHPIQTAFNTYWLSSHSQLIMSNYYVKSHKRCCRMGQEREERK